jgi:shikimate kinase
VSERVALIGLSGAGKTTVAPKVAARLRCDWIDLDVEIARAAGADAGGVAALLRGEGEAAFRRREADALRWALEEDPRPRLIVACGAGALLLSENRDRLAASAVTIWLRVTPGIAAARLGVAPEGDRPLLAGDSAEARLRTLWEDRRASYEAAAAAVVETEGRSPDEVADVVAGIVREAGWA